MIKPINIFNGKRYERMKLVGHQLIFKNWMISIESGSALKRQCKEVLVDLVALIITPLTITLEILRLTYMLMPKIFINKEG